MTPEDDCEYDIDLEVNGKHIRLAASSLKYLLIGFIGWLTFEFLRTG